MQVKKAFPLSGARFNTLYLNSVNVNRPHLVPFYSALSRSVDATSTPSDYKIGRYLASS